METNKNEKQIAKPVLIEQDENRIKELRKIFIETIYDTLSDVISPTPYLEINENNGVYVEYLNGKGRIPKPKTEEITILDMDIASLFFDDIHLLYEGVTGVGKTYTNEALFEAIFGNDFYNLRLSGGILGNSAIEPFITTTMENGYPKTVIDMETCQKYGALLIDEINRGNTQESFQVIDRKIHVNKDTAKLRIPIPGKEGKYKGIAIIAAMNPPDALHNGALEMDIAGENRFLKFPYPNGVTEAGSSQMEKVKNDDLHERFWNKFAEKSGIQGSWKEIYPILTDTELMPTDMDGIVYEFIDVALGYIGTDPEKTFDRNRELFKECGYEPRFEMDKDNTYDEVIERQGTLKHGFVRRDLTKIRDLCRLMGFIKGVKDNSYDPSVRLEDVVASMGIILESKTVTGTEYGNMIALVNDAYSAYKRIREEHKIFEEISEPYGIRDILYNAAIDAGSKFGFNSYIETLRVNINKLNKNTDSLSESIIRSRLLADLGLLVNFSERHEKELTNIFIEKSGDDTFGMVDKLYNKYKRESTVYENRLGSFMG